MTNYRAILEYHYKGNTTTQVARICECSRTTVLKTIKRAKECGLTQSSVAGMNDFKLLCKLYPNRVQRAEYTYPDFEVIIKDKKKRKLTKYVAWRRYYKRTIAAGGRPYKKSQFFKLYKTFYSRSSLRFKNTKTIDQIKAYGLVGRYFESSRMTNSLENLKSEILEFCKKLRLCPQRIF